MTDGGDNIHFIPSTLVLCQFCQEHGPVICFSTQSMPQPQPDVEDEANPYAFNSSRYNDQRKIEQCCRILPSALTHIVTHESRNHHTYISTAHPPREDYPTIREGAIRATHELSNDITVISNNRGRIKSTVITRIFHISDKEARGNTRQLFLMMVMSDRFAALDYVLDLKELFGDIIRTLSDKAKESFEMDFTPPRPPDVLRSIGQVMKFDELHYFLHKKFVDIFYHLENKHLPLTIVPPGKIAELNRMELPPCFCRPVTAESTQGRDRAETLVELPAPRFTDIDEVREMLHEQEDQLKLILQYIVCGKQLVVRGQHPSTVESLLNIFITFLPANCVKSCGYTTRYEHSLIGRFLGLPLDVECPVSGEILVVDAMTCQETPHEIRSFTVKLRLTNEVHKPMRPMPKIVDELMHIIKLSRSQNHQTYAASLSAVLQKWTSKAVTYYLAMKTMEDVDRQRPKLLDILEAHHNDIPVLELFRCALKHTETNKLLNEVQ